MVLWMWNVWAAPENLDPVRVNRYAAGAVMGAVVGGGTGALIAYGGHRGNLCLEPVEPCPIRPVDGTTQLLGFTLGSVAGAGAGMTFAGATRGRRGPWALAAGLGVSAVGIGTWAAMAERTGIPNKGITLLPATLATYVGGPLVSLALSGGDERPVRVGLLARPEGGWDVAVSGRW